MLIVMEGHIFAVIGINPGQGDDRTSKVTADILHNRFWVAEVRLCINIKAVFIFFVYFRLGLFKRRGDAFFKFIQ